MMRPANPSRIALKAWLAAGAALVAGEIALAVSLPSGRERTVVLGVGALLLLLASAAYGPRKWTFAARFGHLYHWALGHMILGAAFMLMVGLHAGAVDIGPQGWVLAGLALAVTASGLWGLNERTATPERFAIHSRGQAAFPTALRQRVALLSDDVTATLARRDADLGTWFAERYQAVMTAGATAPEDCEGFPTRHRRIANKLHLQVLQIAVLRRSLADLEPMERRGRRWLWIHLPLTVALLTLVAVHIAGWLYYG